MTLAEAAVIARESRQTLWRRAKAGQLAVTKRGRTIMVSREALMAYCGVLVTNESPTITGEAIASSVGDALRGTAPS